MTNTMAICMITRGPEPAPQDREKTLHVVVREAELAICTAPKSSNDWHTVAVRTRSGHHLAKNVYDPVASLLPLVWPRGKDGFSVLQS